jgi:hypothetical protein
MKPLISMILFEIKKVSGFYRRRGPGLILLENGFID